MRRPAISRAAGSTTGAPWLTGAAPGRRTSARPAGRQSRWRRILRKMLLHLLFPLRCRQISDRRKKLPVLLHAALEGRSLLRRHRLDSRLHRRIRLGKPIGARQRRPSGRPAGSMATGPVPDHIQKHQHRQQEPPFIASKGWENIRRVHWINRTDWTPRVLGYCFEPPGELLRKCKSRRLLEKSRPSPWAP